MRTGTFVSGIVRCRGTSVGVSCSCVGGSVTTSTFVAGDRGALNGLSGDKERRVTGCCGKGKLGH